MERSLLVAAFVKARPRQRRCLQQEQEALQCMTLAGKWWLTGLASTTTVFGCSWRLLAPMAPTGSSWPLAPPGYSCLRLGPGQSWVLPGSSWAILAPHGSSGSSWLLSPSITAPVGSSTWPWPSPGFHGSPSNYRNNWPVPWLPWLTWLPWLLLAPPGSSWLLLASPGSPGLHWLLLLLAPPGSH